MAARSGELHHGAKLCEEDVIEMRRRYLSEGVAILPLASEYGITYNTARHVLSGSTWKHVPMPGVKQCPNCHGKGRVLE
jgi:hypothetical protein